MSRDGDDQSAHCEGRQESPGEDLGVQPLGPVFLPGPYAHVPLSAHRWFWDPGSESGLVVWHSLFLQKLQGGEVVNAAGVGQAHLLVFRQGTRLGIGQQGRRGPWGQKRQRVTDFQVFGQLTGTLAPHPPTLF